MQTDRAPDGSLHSAAPGLQAEMDGVDKEDGTVEAKIRPIIGQDYQKIVCGYIARAKTSIDICAYVWKWYSHEGQSEIQKINYAIIEKARMNLPIRIRLNKEAAGDPLSAENQRTAAALRRYPVQIKFDLTGTMSHLKMIIIDDEVAIIGSHNLTKRSVSQNNETSVVIIGRTAVRDFVKYFEQLWNG